MTHPGFPFGPGGHLRRLLRCGLAALWTASLAAAAATAHAQENASCMRCHGDDELVVERGEEELSGFVDLEAYGRSAHGRLDCIACHLDLEDEDLPHEDDLELVDCSECHDKAAEVHAAGAHGRAAEAGEAAAPDCVACHGTHGIQRSSRLESPTHPIRVAALCGRCHGPDGIDVREDLPEAAASARFADRIHGPGLRGKGLVASATCVTCHTAHGASPVTDAASPTHRSRVGATCMACHVAVDEIHAEFIEPHTWRETPEQLPICTDCHAPHNGHRTRAPQGAETARCLECHAEGEARAGAPDRLIDADVYRASVHGGMACAQCHPTAGQEHARPCENVGKEVTCATCHARAERAYRNSAHAVVPAENVKPGATCIDCHGIHDIRHNSDRDARINPLNVYRVCGRCHFEMDPETASREDLLADVFTDDAHAHGILASGLMGSATCVSCHGGHDVRAADDPDSLVARHRVDTTCGICHVGVMEQYRKSVHHLRSNGDEEHKGATCTDCHKHHEITTADADFRQRTIDSCTDCHDERGGSFRSSYHGRRHFLGEAADVATCSSCHGAHAILPTDDPASMVHPDNLVATCGSCHEGSHEEFTNYLVHVDVTDPEEHFGLYVVYRLMTTLVVGALMLGCLHALFWLVRALAAKEWRKPPLSATERFVRRWPRSYVAYHMLLMTTVLVLASTGLPLHYADQPWAARLMGVFGGAAAAGWVHRVFGVLLLVLVAVYVTHVAWRLIVKREKGLFTGESTMLPRWKDVTDLLGTLRWFAFLGERPRYGRWTYWEKFDFWAVFWGTGVIGVSGLMLWFPEISTRYVPGWFLNAAVIIHGFEALLDIAFIFTVHVFHANLRPDKFPMDTMYLTGVLPEHEFRHERPLEYDQAVQAGTLDSLRANPPARRTRIWAYVIGTCALAVGIFFVVAMVVAVATRGA